MKQIFFISDTHFFHLNSLKFFNADGTKLRPWEFTEDGMNAMNETMVSNWNEVVCPNDLVYHLGDVTFNNKNLKILERLKGRKRLILGNHDVYDSNFHNKYFEKIYSSHRVDKFLLTHIPVHKDSIPEGYINMHGHIHGEVINDPLYLNVCVLSKLTICLLSFHKSNSRSEFNHV